MIATLKMGASGGIKFHIIQKKGTEVGVNKRVMNRSKHTSFPVYLEVFLYQLNDAP
jgi:ribosomal protein S12